VHHGRSPFCSWCHRNRCRSIFLSGVKGQGCDTRRNLPCQPVSTCPFSSLLRTCTGRTFIQ
jgi:hypothetical protein